MEGPRGGAPFFPGRLKGDSLLMRIARKFGIRGLNLMQLSRKYHFIPILAFKDMGDKRADFLLKAWDSTLANLKPAMA